MRKALPAAVLPLILALPAVAQPSAPSAPDSLAARQHLARLHLRREQPEEALAELRAAARLGPLDRSLALWLAAAETAAGNDAAAEEQLTSVAGRFDSVRALLELARLHARRGESEPAAASLRRALELAPNSEAVLSAYAKVSLAARVPVPAIEALAALARMHSDEVEYAYLLGVARLQVGETDGAVTALERALELAPRRALTLIALGMARNGQKRFDEAREVLERSLELAPESAEALAALAEAEEGLGELEPAEDHARRALEKAESHAGALFVLGKVRMSQGRYAEARDALVRAVEADPSSSKAHYQLSLAYARLGDSESSRKHVELYREAQRAAEELLIELRTRSGLGAGGMG